MLFTYNEISSQSSGNKTLIVLSNEIPRGFMVKENNQWFVLRPGKTKFEPETFSDQNEAAKHLVSSHS
jgi:hypothetical protein